MVEQTDPELTFFYEHTKITTICKTTINEKDWNLPPKKYLLQLKTKRRDQNGRGGLKIKSQTTGQAIHKLENNHTAKVPPKQ